MIFHSFDHMSILMIILTSYLTRVTLITDDSVVNIMALPS